MAYTAEDDDDFDWDDDNVDHIARHGAVVDEVMDAFMDPQAVQLRSRTVGKEVRWSFVARTSAGRTLFVVYTRRSGRVRVVTARDAAPRESAFYRRHRGKR
jgi:uncharacterized DUF497 family protein